MKFLLSHAVKESPGAPFIITPERTLSFNDVFARVRAATAWLQRNGIAPLSSVPVPVEAPRNLRTVTLCLALFELGVPVLLLHPGWSPMERLRILRQAGLRAPALPDSFTSSARASQRVVPLTAPAADSTLAVIYTSGSSAQPKGIRLSRGAFAAAIAASSQNLGWEPEDRWLLSLPLAHVGGLSCLLRCLTARKPLVMPSLSGNHERMEVRQLLDLMDRTKVTVASVVPTQLRRLLDLEQRAPKSLRALLVGGAATPQTLYERAVSLGWPILTTYGLTETCSQVTTQRYGKAPHDARGSGHPLAGTEVRVTEGRIEVRSGTLFSGYFPEGEPPLAEGWFATGDLGVIHEPSGELRVLGRADDVIVSGGENVHPEQVEEVLQLYPGVRAACVFGIESGEWGHSVAAAICAVSTLELDKLAEFVRSELGAFKAPKQWVLVDELPMTPTGKVSRALARQQLAERCRPLQATTP